MHFCMYLAGRYAMMRAQMMPSPAQEEPRLLASLSQQVLASYLRASLIKDDLHIQDFPKLLEK